jgi:hypothetical protein
MSTTGFGLSEIRSADPRVRGRTIPSEARNCERA